MGTINDVDGCLGDTGMPVDTVEICTYEFAVPCPVVFSVAGRVNTQITSSRFDISFKGCFLVVIEYMTGCEQEDNSVILPQVLIGKN